MRFPSWSMTRWLAVALTLAAAPIASAADFEGVIEMEMSGGDEQNHVGRGRTLVSSVGSRTEIGMSEGKEAGMKMVMLVLKAEPNVVYMLNEQKKTYYRQEHAQKADRPHEARKHTYKVTRKGTGRVAGYDCVIGEVLRDDEEQPTEIWTSRAVGGFESFWRHQAQRDKDDDYPTMLSALKNAGMDGWPMKVVTQRKSGKSTEWEVTKVEKRSVPASQFSLAGYTKTDSVMGGMQLSPEQEKQMEQARQQMQEAMKKMTPEQRQKMEEMMKAMGGKGGK
jgi:hypothetical protein